MAGYGARQSTYTTADTIEASDSNDEFDQLLAAFHASTGHTHDGSTAGDGPTLTAVGALTAGSITATFGAIDIGTSNFTTGGQYIIDVDGTAEGAAGALTLGAGSDAGIFFDGTNLVIIANGAGAGGIILDAEDDTLEIKGSGTLQATFDTSGLNLVSGDAYYINSTSVLNATTLGGAVVASSLTSVGTLAGGAISSGFGNIDIGASTFDAGVSTFAGLVYNTVTDAITAGSTQTQAGATALTTQFNRVTVSGTNGDGVALPTAAAGLECIVINDDAAQTIQVWPFSGDAIDGGSVDAVDANAIIAASSRRYIAIDGTNWYTASEAGNLIGTDVQAWDAQLDDIAALAVTNGNFIVGDGANWVAESGATARTSLGIDAASGNIAAGDIAANAIDSTKTKDALIGDYTEVVVAATDSFLLGDVGDSGNTKRDTVQGILDLTTAGGPAVGTAPSTVYRTNAKVQNENLVLSDHSTTFTATNATNVLNVGTDDDFANDTNVRLTTSGADLPNGWAIDTDYYVIGATSNTMQLAATVGGAAVTISDDGTGTHTVFEVINAMTSGPITIKTGNSLTIPSGSRVVII